MEFGDPLRVVGIVPHLQKISDDKSDRPQIYEPLDRNRTPCQFHLLVADSALGNQAALFKRIRAEIQRVAPEMPVLSIMSLADYQHDNIILSYTRFGAKLAMTFGAMALFLAALGIYAVKGYMVASRTPEIGIRKALGATAGNIMSLVFCEGLIHTIAGLIVGLLLGLAAARLVNRFLYGVDALDPFSFLITIALLALASFLASYVPARRAAKIDPMEALRYE
jgi:ABC-type antimicrobial peptide transport system permease subunit